MIIISQNEVISKVQFDKRYSLVVIFYQINGNYCLNLVWWVLLQMLLLCSRLFVVFFVLFFHEKPPFLCISSFDHSYNVESCTLNCRYLRCLNNNCKETFFLMDSRFTGHVLKISDRLCYNLKYETASQSPANRNDENMLTLQPPRHDWLEMLSFSTRRKGICVNIVMGKFKRYLKHWSFIILQLGDLYAANILIHQTMK